MDVSRSKAFAILSLKSIECLSVRNHLITRESSFSYRVLDVWPHDEVQVVFLAGPVLFLRQFRQLPESRRCQAGK